MRSRKAYCQALGLTQQEMALILSISRSTWSMYVLGLRDIPTQSMRLLHEMLDYVAAESDARAAKPAAAHWQGIEKYIGQKHRKTSTDLLSVSLNHAAARKAGRTMSRELSRQFLEQKQKSDLNKRLGEIAQLLKGSEKEKKMRFDQAFTLATLEFQRQWLEEQLIGLDPDAKP